MNSASPVANKILWSRAILNGFLAWAIGMLLYIIPGLVVGFKMGFELGPKLRDNSAVSSQISQTVSAMYRENTYVLILYAVLMLITIFWRSKKLSLLPASNSMMNGALIGVVPALITSIYLFTNAVHFTMIAEILLFIAAGIAGGIKKSQS